LCPPYLGFTIPLLSDRLEHQAPLGLIGVDSHNLKRDSKMPAGVNIVKVHDLSIAGLDSALSFIPDFSTRPLIQVDLLKSYQLVFIAQKFSGFGIPARDTNQSLV
jgi:hypothetical protein